MTTGSQNAESEVPAFPSPPNIYDSLEYIPRRQAKTARELFGPALPYLNHVVSKHFPEDREARIFELGCGPGPLIFAARNLGYENVTGIDISREQLELGRQLGVPGLMHGDALSALESLPPASLDVLVAFDFLEHLSFESLLDSERFSARALKAGGRFIIHVPNGESPFGARMRYWDITHQRAFTENSLRQLLTKDFARIEVFEDKPVVHGLKSAVRWATWLVVRSAARVWLAAECGTLSDPVLSQNLLAVAHR
jgi:SAM-dependent methyltransferase